MVIEVMREIEIMCQSQFETNELKLNDYSVFRETIIICLKMTECGKNTIQYKSTLSYIIISWDQGHLLQLWLIWFIFLRNILSFLKDIQNSVLSYRTILSLFPFVGLIGVLFKRYSQTFWWMLTTTRTARQLDWLKNTDFSLSDWLNIGGPHHSPPPPPHFWSLGSQWYLLTAVRKTKHYKMCFDIKIHVMLVIQHHGLA